MLVDDFMLACNLRKLYLVVGCYCLGGNRRLHLGLNLVARHWFSLHFLRSLSELWILVKVSFKGIINKVLDLVNFLFGLLLSNIDT